MTTKELQEDFVERIQRVVLRPASGIHEPNITMDEVLEVEKCVRSGDVSTISPKVHELESLLSECTGAKHVVATSSGTSALHLALLAVGASPDTEILVPPLTYVATVNAVRYCGAEPHFVDIEDESFAIDPEKLREYLRTKGVWRNGKFVNRTSGRRFSALVPVYVFGLVLRSKEIIQVAQEFDIPVVADAAEALGSFEGNSHAGTDFAGGVLSFNGNKIVTTGGGGAVITDNPQVALLARHLGSVARRQSDIRHDHDQVGFNYKMPGINAALGIAQLTRLTELLQRKRELHVRYGRAFDGCEYFRLVAERDGTRSNFWLNTVVLQDLPASQLTTFIESAQSKGIPTRAAWKLISDLDMYDRSPRAPLTCASSIAPRILNLPSSPSLVDALE